MGTWDSWIGKLSVINNYLDHAPAQKMQVLLDREPTISSGDVLPPAWHWLYFHELAKTHELGNDGHTQLGITMPPFQLPRRMWAGGKIYWLRPLVLGSSARRESQIIKIEEKTGSTGKLIFVTVEHQISQANELCIREEHEIVYRENGNPEIGNPTTEKINTAPKSELADENSDFSSTWKFNEAGLFRYSALTFNSHRIHYDSDYTRDVEGYAGLIVHGSLLSTLMLDLALKNGCSVRQFNYGAKSPITLPNSFTVHGKSETNTTQLRVANEDGNLAMQGTLS